MDRLERLKLLQDAAELASKGSSAQIGMVWNISPAFDAARARVLPGHPRQQARTYLQLLDALVGVSQSERDHDLLDSAVLSICLAVQVGIADLTDAELEAAMAGLFDPPLGKPGALDELRAQTAARRRS